MGIRSANLPTRRSYNLNHMLHSRPLRWRTAFTYTLVIGALMVLLALLTMRAVEQWRADQQQAHHVAQSAATASYPPLLAAWQDTQQLTRVLGELAPLLGARGTVFTQDEVPIADSRSLPAPSAISLPELRHARDEGVGISQRADEATGDTITFVAHPIVRDGATVGVIRWAFPAATTAGLPVRRLLWPMLAVTVAITGLMIFQAERAARTVRQLTGVADRITAGELNARVLSLSSGEIGQLARAFNRMAANLEEQILRSARETDRLNTIMHVMTDGVLIVNKQGRVRLINPAAATILRTDEETALQRSFVQVVRDHRIAEVWQQCHASGRQELAALELGSERFLQVVITPFLQGADRGYLVILQDLTRLRRLQTIRQDFVSNVSHELRTPLAALRALVDTLRDGALEDPPAARRFLDRMETEVDALTQMVQELLELARIESGKAPLQLRSVAVAELLAPGVERLRPQAERAGIVLTLHLPSHLPPVQADADRITQVVTNLVHNAVKFTPAGGAVTVTAAPQGERLLVSVADTGTGIPKDDLTRIFERFYKTDRARAGGGTGLGLAIAKHIVHAHSGEIWAESEVGRGSRFYFTLMMAD